MSEPIFTTAWAVQNYALWHKHLGKFKGNETHALEIGSFEGRSSCFFVQNILTHEKSTLTCVDPFVMGSEDKFLHNIKALDCEKKITLIKSKSDDFHDISRTAWDFVYVDGLHTARACLIDMARSWTSLKKGGVMVVDDVLWCLNERPRVDCPKLAIDAFMNICEKELRVLYYGNQAIFEKTA